MEHNLKIGYSGGSGGFLLFHLLLLSDNYSTIFNSADSLATIIDKQWNISNHLSWKKTEIWPDDNRLLNTDLLTPKLYLLCNPDRDINEWTKYDAKSLILYTDLPSQLILAKYKRANWYHIIYEAKRKWDLFYNSVKGADWPPCSDYYNMIYLPDWVQKELIEFGAENFCPGVIKPPSVIDNSIMFGNTPILNTMYSLLTSADYTIKLQDLVNTNGNILVELLGIPPINEQQHNLLSHWRSLHSKEILDKIGIV
jgi:hypothetical protein